MRTLFAWLLLAFCVVAAPLALANTNAVGAQNFYLDDRLSSFAVRVPMAPQRGVQGAVMGLLPQVMGDFKLSADGQKLLRLRLVADMRGFTSGNSSADSQWRSDEMLASARYPQMQLSLTEFSDNKASGKIYWRGQELPISLTSKIYLGAGSKGLFSDVVGPPNHAHISLQGTINLPAPMGDNDAVELQLWLELAGVAQN